MGMVLLLMESRHDLHGGQFELCPGSRKKRHQGRDQMREASLVVVWSCKYRIILRVLSYAIGDFAPIGNVLNKNRYLEGAVCLDFMSISQSGMALVDRIALGHGSQSVWTVLPHFTV